MKIENPRFWEWEAADYLTKPFSINEFAARVQSLIRRYTTLNNSKITITTEQKWKLPFLLIVIGQSISLIGSSAVQFALIWWITSETNSALLLGLSCMVAYVPVVLLSPAAGVMADRYNRKVICICADLFVGLSAAVFALLLWLYEMPIWRSNWTFE